MKFGGGLLGLGTGSVQKCDGQPPPTKECCEGKGFDICYLVKMATLLSAEVFPRRACPGSRWGGREEESRMLQFVMMFEINAYVCGKKW